MKKIFLIALFAVLTAGASAQGIRKLRQQLYMPDSLNGARIETVEESTAATAIELSDRVARQETVEGYRVSLFRDNKQNSGEDARAVETLFKEHFPGVAVSVSYESPYFKVTAGNFIDRVDAIALQGKALHYFPKAVVIMERGIPVADIIGRDEAIADKEVAPQEGAAE
jgi:hypothetical protein